MHSHNVRGTCRAIATMILIVCISAQASATTLTVKKDGTGDYTTIEAGTFFADSGDTVLVYAGTYYEPMIIIHYKVVYLISEAGPEATIIRLSPRPMTEEYTVIEIWDAPAGCVKGFTISSRISPVARSV